MTGPFETFVIYCVFSSHLRFRPMCMVVSILLHFIIFQISKDVIVCNIMEPNVILDSIDDLFRNVALC